MIAQLSKKMSIGDLLNLADTLINDADEMLKENKSMQSNIAKWHVDHECYIRGSQYRSKDNIS